MANTAMTLAAMWLSTFGAESIVPNFAELLKDYSSEAVKTAAADVTSLFADADGELDDPMGYLLDLCSEYAVDPIYA